MGIFDKRVAFKPFEYPELVEYKNAINHSYWLVSEWNFISDIQDFNVKLNNIEKSAIKNAMLAISQIEISVKKFWTKLGDRFPKAEFDQVGVTFGECFIDGTEILTPWGWVDLSEIEEGDEVIQYNPDNTLNITEVKHKTDQNYSGNMVKFSNNYANLVVTPNHRMVFHENGEYKEDFAINCEFGRNDKKLPKSVNLKGGNKNKLDYKEILCVSINAGGFKLKPQDGFQEYEIKVKKENKIKIIENALENLKGINYEKSIISNDLSKYVIKTNNKYNYKELEWVNLYDKTSEWCQDFIKLLAEWEDVKVSDENKFKIIVINKKVADKVQMIGTCAGYKVEIESANDKIYKDRCAVIFNKNFKILPALNKEIISFKGKIRCVTVESGAILTRYKDKTFISGNSEVRHADAYSHLLQVLGLNDDFAMLLQNPVIQGRVDYLTKYLKGAADNSNENYTLTLTLFSIFIENVSLFSQFLIIKSFNKYKNVLKDIDNVVQATQVEEQLHALLGVYVIKQVQKEFPDWFNEEFYEKLYRACNKAYEAEVKIIDWIFEAGELSFLPKDVVIEFIKDRFNQSLEMIGGKKIFEVNKEKVAKVKWFDDEIHANVNTDFFHKKPVTYSKFSKPVQAEDLF